VFGVEVRLRPIRVTAAEANFIIIVLRTRSVLEMRMRTIAALEARARTTNLADAEGSGVEMVWAALMTVVLVVRTISSWLDKVINGSIVLILLLLVRHVVGLMVGDVVLLVRGVVRGVVLLVREVDILLAISRVSETKLMLAEATANKALETVEAIS
jgi:hypothetical protein